MTRPDAMQLFIQKCDELGQAAVAKAIGKSASAVNQLYHGNYKAEPGVILELIVEQFGGLFATCPVDGDITLATCARNRRKPFESATNPHAVRLYRACRKCPHNGGNRL